MTQLSRNIRQHGNENSKGRLQIQGLRGKRINNKKKERKKRRGRKLLRASEAVNGFLQRVAFELA